MPNKKRKIQSALVTAGKSKKSTQQSGIKNFLKKKTELVLVATGVHILVENMVPNILIPFLIW